MANEGYYVEIELDSGKEKNYYYSSFSNIKKGDYVVVESEFGVEVAKVSKEPVLESESEGYSYKSILRIASDEDKKFYFTNKESALEAGKIFSECVEALNLNMKLVDVCYTLDKSKILYRYVSEERVDFRELLKELSNKLKCRIELKQIGPRDRSKLVGGIGICGLPLCCKSFLSEFEGISINMAKNQFLALNIQKLSGQCGKLLCCLKYEDDDYSELRKDAPRYGTRFTHDGVNYKITGVNLLAKTVKIESADKEIIKVVTFDEVNGMIK